MGGVGLIGLLFGGGLCRNFNSVPYPIRYKILHHMSRVGVGQSVFSSRVVPTSFTSSGRRVVHFRNNTLLHSFSSVVIVHANGTFVHHSGGVTFTPFKTFTLETYVGGLHTNVQKGVGGLYGTILRRGGRKLYIFGVSTNLLGL